MKAYYMALALLFIIVSCKQNEPKPKAVTTQQVIGIQEAVQVTPPPPRTVPTRPKREEVLMVEEEAIPADFVPEHIRRSHIEVVEHY